MKNKLTLKILLFLVFTDVLETFTQFCFKKTALTENDVTITSLAHLVIFIKAMLVSPFLWIGLLSVASIFVVWSTILSKIDLSIAVPIASLSYVLVPITSVVFLHESISLTRWMGIACILFGVVLVSMSQKDHHDSTV